MTSVSALARLLPPAPGIAVPAPSDSASPPTASAVASPRSPPVSSHGLLASGVLSSLLQAQSVAEDAAATARSAVATTAAAVRAYSTAQGLPARPHATAATTLLEGVVIYTS